MVSLKEIAAFANNDMANLDPEILVLDQLRLPCDLSHVPLRIDSLVLMLCSSGTGRISVDLEEHALRRDTLVTLNPHNYISLTECSDDMRCTVMVCSRRVVEEVIPKLTVIFPLIVHNRRQPVKALSEAEAARVRSYIMFIKEQMDRPPTQFRTPKVLSLLQAALFELMEVSDAHTEVRRAVSSRKEELTAEFILCVLENFTKHRQVGYYADRLCITSKHLSAVVKDTSGRTPGEWIEEHVVLEAKMLLKTTDLPVQEIAARLNFANQSFFGKYFKNLTGMSPSDYRQLSM